MLNFLRRKPPSDQIKELLASRSKLFAMDELPTLVNRLSPIERQEHPWSQFVKAEQALANRDAQGAAVILQQISGLAEVETRAALLAWHNLRAQGVQPDDTQARQVLGIVLETPSKNDLNILAVYADYRLYHVASNGPLIAWNGYDGQLSALMDEIRSSSQPLLERAQPWNKPEPGPPPPGFARLSILTPAGLHFGQGPLKFLLKDKIGGEVVGRANAVIRRLNQVYPTINKEIGT